MFGKSTASQKLAESLDKSALIEGDDIYHQVVGSYTPAWKEGNHLDTFWKICINTIKTYLEDGYDVIFNYIVTPTQLENIKKEFKNYSVKFVVLLTDEDTLLSRDKERPEDCQMKERCITLLNSFKNNNFNKENILDTTNLTIDETIGIIENDNRFYVSNYNIIDGKYRYTYNKLVRDKIPEEINREPGRKSTYKILDNKEYLEELNKKVLEEANEFIEENSIEELGDLMEVLNAIMKLKNYKPENLNKIMKSKSDKKGSFNDKIYLEYVDEDKRNIEEEKELNKKFRK